MMKKLFALLLMFSIASFAYATDLYGYKSEIVFFTGNPNHGEGFLRHFPNGVLYVENGKVASVGDFEELKGQYPTAIIKDYAGKLIVPGFIDTHVHYPQTEMMASYGDQLLDWLNNYTFPTERQFSDKATARRVAELFLDQLMANGTTTALVFSTVSPVSVDAFFEAAYARNARMITGKVLMDRNSPDYLSDTAESGYVESKSLIEKWRNVGRLAYAVTPRFAPTSSPAQLESAKRLLDEYPGVYLQTHVAENKDEVAWVKKLFPKSRSYLDVYDSFGLVTNHSIFAHGIYLDDQDMKTLSKKDGAISFCPTSNLFLGSGLFDLDRAEKFKVKVGFGTDVGAGTSLSILATMNEGYKVSQLRKAYARDPSLVKPLDPIQSLYFATLGGAKALSLDDKIGSFKPGMEADFVVLDPSATPLLAAKINNSKTLSEKLFAFQILGDDRAVQYTYVMGRQSK